jgi:hypothetical protein
MKFPTVRFGALLALTFALGACLNPSSEPAAVRAPDSAPRATVAGPVDPAKARDVFVLLSGGVQPMSNNYSQYLQAKAVAKFFEQNYPLDSVWTFFGAGNIEGQAPLFGDVMRNSRRDGLMLSAWLPGSLNRNRPAKRDAILKAFRDEILPKVSDGGTVYLFVGDHGSQRATGDKESLVNLWQLVRDEKSERGWKTDNTENLSVSDLRKVLAEGLGRGRLVFCMTQCHSGGFHHLAAPRELAPNPRWFAKLPDWALPKPGATAPAPVDYVRAAGFTATDENNLAAGCDPDPDPEKWAGYERFIPENLFGLDLFTLAPAGVRRSSFYEAHVEATLVDRTIDKPYSTSEAYLDRWAALIETKLAKEPNLTAKVKQQVAAYQRAVESGKFTAKDPAFRERQELFARFTQRLTEQNTAVKELLLAGTRQQLDEASVPPGRGGGARNATTPPPAQTAARGQPGAPATTTTPAPAQAQRGGGGRGRGGVTAAPEVLKIWNETIRPAWKTAVMADKVPALAPGAAEFEKYLLGVEAKGKDFLFADAGTLRNEVFWKSGYHDPVTLDATKAEAVVRWGSERRNKILAWAKASGDKALVAAVEDLEKRQNAARPTPPPAASATTAPAVAQNVATRPAAAPTTNVSTRPLSRKTAAERVLFYRRTLAAWEFLLALDEREALDRIREFTELERTPLPRGRT